VNATIAGPRTNSTAMADLVLLRYALPHATPKLVREDLGKVLEREPTASDIDELRAELVADGLMSRGPRNAFVLTDAGRQRAVEFLGLSELPPRTTWATALAKYVFPKAMGLSPEAAAKLRKSEQLEAFVLKRKYGLPSAAGSSLSQVLEAIACKELGFPEEATLAGLLRTVLSRLVGSKERLTKDQLRKQLPRFETGLVKGTAEEARRVLVRDWLAGAATPPLREKPAQAEPFDLVAFASTVRAIAADSPAEDRFHDNKIFIAPLWKRSQQEPNFPRMTLAEFKQRLIEANGQHLLHLSRADLVQAMDPRLVAESETVYLNATFHFVLREETRP
jgi:hypothetical protein